MSKIDLYDVQAGDELTFKDGTKQIVNNRREVFVYWDGPVVFGKVAVPIEMIRDGWITGHRTGTPEKPLWPCRECGANDFEDAGNECSTSFLCAVDKGRETGEITEVLNDAQDDDDQQHPPSGDDDQQEWLSEEDFEIGGSSEYEGFIHAKEVMLEKYGPRSDWMLKSELTRIMEEYHASVATLEREIDKLKADHAAEIDRLKQLLLKTKLHLSDYSKVIYDSIEYGPYSTRCISLKKHIQELDGITPEHHPAGNDSQ